VVNNRGKGRQTDCPDTIDDAPNNQGTSQAVIKAIAFRCIRIDLGLILIIICLLGENQVFSSLVLYQ